MGEAEEVHEGVRPGLMGAPGGCGCRWAAIAGLLRDGRNFRTKWERCARTDVAKRLMGGTIAQVFGEIGSLFKYIQQIVTPGSKKVGEWRMCIWVDFEAKRV